MLGIIGAMDIEVAEIKNIMENAEKQIISGLEFVCGEFSGRKVVVAKCGPGKVNAARTVLFSTTVTQPSSENRWDTSRK